MKLEIITLLLALCTQADLTTQDCPTIIVKDIPAVAQHAVSKKSGKQYILVNMREFKKLSTKEIKETLVHELGHGKVWAQYSKTSHKHGSKFKKACLNLISKTEGLSKSSCKASF